MLTLFYPHTHHSINTHTHTHTHLRFYSYPIGAQTPFGEQMLVYARSLAKEQSVDPQAIADAYEEYYSPKATSKRPFQSYFDNATKVCVCVCAVAYLAEVLPLPNL